MAASGPGNPGLDQGTASLRRLMLQAAEDDAARAQALSTIVQRRVLVATWPHSPESVRTLTNSDGEQAMPLFSGLDVLLDAARRFGWANPDGSVSHRELDAIQALRGAITHAVHFVVLDMCTDCTLEFGRDEIEQALRAAVAAGADNASERATSATRQMRTRAETNPQPAEERSTGLTAAVVEQSATPRGRATRPDPRAEPMLATPLAAVAVARVPQAVVHAARQQTQARAALGTDITQRVSAEPATPQPAESAFEAPAVPAQEAPAAAPAFPALDTAFIPPLAAMPQVADRPTPKFDLPSLESAPMLSQPEAAASPRPSPRAHEVDLAAAFGGDEPQANPAALAAAAMVTQVGKMSKDAGTKQAASEVANMLKDMAMKGGVDESQPSAAQSAAKALAAMLGADPGPKKKRRGEKKSSADVQAAREAAAEPAPESAAQEGADAAKAEVHGLRPLEVSLDDALLSQLADALRKHPEVEWACEVSDGSGVPVVAVRVDPGFMTHVALIKSAIVRAGEAHRAPLSVLVLDDPQQMREARAQGNLFFPWRKRAATR